MSELDKFFSHIRAADSAIHSAVLEGELPVESWVVWNRESSATVQKILEPKEGV